MTPIEQYEYLKIQQLNNGTILHVTLNRANKRNAINAEMWREIGFFFRNVTTSTPECRCILVTGSGLGFCAGIDVSDEKFQSVFSNNLNSNVDVAREYLSAQGMIRDMQDAFSALEDKCPVPVIVAIHGSCIGAGVDLACAADVRLCDSSATFSIREVKLGLAADVGTLQRFPKVIGNMSLARELCFTGRKFSADMALQVGFVSKICSSAGDLYNQAITICKEIAENSPVAVAGTKKSLIFSRDHSVREGLEHISIHNAAALMTNDMAISFLANSINKKNSTSTPTYEDLLPLSKL